MTYGRCVGSKSFGPQADSFRAKRGSPFLKRPEQNRCPKRGPQTRSSCSRAYPGIRPGLSRSNQSREDIFGISPVRTAMGRASFQRTPKALIDVSCSFHLPEDNPAVDIHQKNRADSEENRYQRVASTQRPPSCRVKQQGSCEFHQHGNVVDGNLDTIVRTDHGESVGGPRSAMPACKV